MFNATTPGTEFDDHFDLASVYPSSPANIDASTSTARGLYYYVPENNNALLRRGQSSHFVIKATYQPGQVITAVTGSTSGVLYTYTSYATTNSSANYIYTLKEFGGIPAGTYFATFADVQKAVWYTAHPTEAWVPTPAQTTEVAAIVHINDGKNKEATTSPSGKDLYYAFTGCKSFYRLDLGESTNAADLRPGVLRGKAYNASINSITGPGMPNEDEVELKPEDPVVSMTYISAVIKVLDWSVVSQVGDLKSSN
jgi:hypothetical protein